MCYLCTFYVSLTIEFQNVASIRLFCMLMRNIFNHEISRSSVFFSFFTFEYIYFLADLCSCCFRFPWQLWRFAMMRIRLIKRMISSPMTDNTNGTVSPVCLKKIPADERNRSIVSTWFGKLWLRLFNLFEWETPYRWSAGLYYNFPICYFNQT